MREIDELGRAFVVLIVGIIVAFAYLVVFAVVTDIPRPSSNIEPAECETADDGVFVSVCNTGVDMRGPVLYRVEADSALLGQDEIGPINGDVCTKIHFPEGEASSYSLTINQENGNETVFRFDKSTCSRP